MMNHKYAVITVSDAVYYKGTQVLLYSFLQHNSWFNGDIIILHDGSIPKEIDSYGVNIDVDLHEIGDELKERIKALVGSGIIDRKVQNRLFSLYAFSLQQYEKILFLDSDILCRGDIQSLFLDERAGLIACPDNQFYFGRKRNLYSFLPCNSKDDEDQGDLIDSFNSGVMMINMKQLSSQTYQELLQLITPFFYRRRKTGHTDQYVLNHYFLHNHAFASHAFNYLLKSRNSIDELYKTSIEKAKLIHYVGMKKPWDVKNILTAPKSTRLWHMSFEQFNSRSKNQRGND